jgi:hypothetical protein
MGFIVSCQYNPAVALLMSSFNSKIYFSSERGEELPDFTDAHSIPYQNEIQYFSLRHEEKLILASFKL